MSLLRKHTPPVAHDVEVETRSEERDLPGLLAQLADADPVIRRFAAQDLAAHPESAGPLFDRLQREGDVSVRDAVLATLVELRSHDVAPRLVELLRSEDVRLRNAVFEAIAEMGTVSGPALVEAAHGEDRDVRIFATQLLGQCLGDDAAHVLGDVLAHDPDPNVASAAIEQLGEIGSESAAEVIERSIAGRPEGDYIRFAGQLALKRIRGR